jgi:hypothetical protein
MWPASDDDPTILNLTSPPLRYNTTTTFHLPTNFTMPVCLPPTSIPPLFLHLAPQYSMQASDPISQAYNSIFNHDSTSTTSPLLCSSHFPLLPLRTRVRGPAYTLPLDPSLPLHLSPEPDSESYDALDEVLSLFRANTFFRNFEIQGPADRLMIYGILWVSECLGKIRPGMSAR